VRDDVSPLMKASFDYAGQVLTAYAKYVKASSLSRQERSIGTESSMTTEPQSFRHRFVSLYQSAVDEVVRSTHGLVGLASRPGLDHDLIHVATQVAELKATGTAELPERPPAKADETAWTFAKMSFELMEARACGDTAKERRIRNDFRFNVCDPRWIRTIESYAKYFGPHGTGSAIPYVRAAQVGPRTVPLKPGATVALIADWGTGTDIAVSLLEELALKKPDVVIHLGDIYYSGTSEECDVNFKRIIDTILERATQHIPVYTLAGNHDMYSGGAGYYGLLATLNCEACRQPASFFCLRNEHWQFIAMDTGLHDYDPLTVDDVVTFLEKDEEDWIVDRIAEFKGKTILLSHHPLFSAFSRIGPVGEDGVLCAHNPMLAQSFERFRQAAKQPIAAWFWGHEHNLYVYESYLGLERGRCIGHGAVPVFTSASTYLPHPGISSPPALARVQLDANDKIYMHGFTIIKLAENESASVEYYEDNDATNPIFMETI